MKNCDELKNNENEGEGVQDNMNVNDNKSWIWQPDKVENNKDIKIS